MFPQKTLFVVGAGASWEFGLPLGSELVTNVQSALTFKSEQGFRGWNLNDEQIENAIRRIANSKGTSIDYYMGMCKQINEGVSAFLSIDNYLHSHSSNDVIVNIGKIAISRLILSAERKSNLFSDESGERPFSLKKN